MTQRAVCRDGRVVSATDYRRQMGAPFCCTCGRELRFSGGIERIGHFRHQPHWFAGEDPDCEERTNSRSVGDQTHGASW
jgi:hypothetical protein